MAIGHEQTAQIFLVELTARSCELSDSTDRCSLGRLTARIGVNFRIDEHDVDIGIGSHDVVQTAVTDVISPAVAAVHPNRLLDDVFFMSQDVFLKIGGFAGQLSSHQFFEVRPADGLSR